MLTHEIKSIWETENRLEFRKFGNTMGVFLILLGLVFTYFSFPYSKTLLLSGGLLLLLGMLVPVTLRPIFAIWMSLATLLGFIMTRVLLGIIFFLIFTPVGLVLRLLQKDLLDESIDPDAESYWKPRKPGPYAPELSEKQF